MGTALRQLLRGLLIGQNGINTELSCVINQKGAPGDAHIFHEHVVVADENGVQGCRVQNYIGYITSADPGIHLNTLFKVPLAHQRHACSTEYRARSKLTRRSESAVNTSLVSFLQALAMVTGPLGSEWNADRIPLRADFGGQVGSFTAVTNGQLQDVTSKRIPALVECKRGERDEHNPRGQIN